MKGMGDTFAQASFHLIDLHLIHPVHTAMTTTANMKPRKQTTKSRMNAPARHRGSSKHACCHTKCCRRSSVVCHRVRAGPLRRLTKDLVGPTATGNRDAG